MPKIPIYAATTQFPAAPLLLHFDHRKFKPGTTANKGHKPALHPSTLSRRRMQNSPRRFIRVGAVCFVRASLLADSSALLGSGFAFDKGHHHARHLQSVVAVLQAVNACAVQVFTQTFAATVE